MNNVPRANVVAVCSSERHEVDWANENIEYKTYDIGVYGSYDDMLEQPGLEAVWISTSTDVHASQTLAAIQKGLHVLCEKPLSTDLDEVRNRKQVRNCLSKARTVYNVEQPLDPVLQSIFNLASPSADGAQVP